MGSELDSGSLLEGGRGVRGEDGDEGALRGVATEGGIVAPSRLASSPSTVVSESKSTVFPHEEQNRASGETCAPHFEQNMEGGFYHWSRPAANAPKNSYEMRSTWTAVP
jgi:hypothetical protein